jgi:hypothetical protein
VGLPALGCVRFLVSPRPAYAGNSVPLAKPHLRGNGMKPTFTKANRNLFQD